MASVQTMLDKLQVEVDKGTNKRAPAALQEWKEIWVEYQRIVKEAKRHASKPKAYKAKATRKFPLDLSGWRYSLTQEEETKAVGAILLTAQLKFKPRKTALGTFDGGTRTLVIDVQGDPQTLSGFKEALASLGDTLIHELGHLGQLVMTITKGESGGMPSRNIAPDPKFDQWGNRRGPFGPDMDLSRQKYLLRGMEFYPWVRDGIRQFTRAVRKIRQEDRADAARIWVGEKPKDHRGPALNDWRQRVPRALWGPNDLYSALKADAPELWEKAVKEFYKGVQSEL